MSSDRGLCLCFSLPLLCYILLSLHVSQYLLLTILLLTLLFFFQDHFQKFLPTVGGQLGSAGQGVSYGKGSGGGQAGDSSSAGQYGSDHQRHQGSGSGAGGATGAGGHAGRGGAAGAGGAGEVGSGKYLYPRVMDLVPRAQMSSEMRPRLGAGDGEGSQETS